MIKFKRRPSVEINSSSMADIAFLLLIFFLVTTTISMDQGLEIVLPSEGNEMKVNPNNITVISINESGKVLFNGRLIREMSLNQNNLYQLKSLVENELANNEKMIFSVLKNVTSLVKIRCFSPNLPLIWIRQFPSS